ncbi:hypothetical protein ACEN8I_07910 [Polaromonas sp. CT11-55]|uniref:hypothetical protein n=1 Tax=Polaromonas sp. CT11-55 TaxID=3243045 RepID=UPI0039A560C2
MSTNAMKASPAHWLVGKRHSDRERTIHEWGDFPPGSADFQRLVQRDLGKLFISYDGNTSTTTFEETGTSSPYKVLWCSNDSVFLVLDSGEEESGQHIHFQSPTVYWVHTGRFIEFFSKVNEN